MGEVRELIATAMSEQLKPFGLIEVGGAVFGELMNELADETKQLVTGMSPDLVVHVQLPDGTLVYLNPALHPGAVMISNVRGQA